MNNAASWIISQNRFTPEQLHQDETRFTIGNGYLGTRGTFEEGYPGQQAATLIHGVFDEAPVVFTELANAPDWTALTVCLDGERFSLAQGEVLAFERALDMRHGLLTRRVHWRSPLGREVILRFERFASLDDVHLLGQRLTIQAVNFTGKVEVRAGVEAHPENLGLLHWDRLTQGVKADTVWLELRTRQSSIQLGMAARIFPCSDGWESPQGWDAEAHPTLVLQGAVDPARPLVMEKWTAVFTSRDVDDPLAAARAHLDGFAAPTWERAFSAHRAAWDRAWAWCDVQIEGNPDDQRALRFNLYHLLIAAPHRDGRVSIGAKSLSGFGYRGHVFWDTEIFMLPFFTCTRPEIARNLLTYRYHTLPGARRKAQANGFPGAQYPWESADTGDEVTPTWVPDAHDRTRLIRIWTGDIQIHVSADIAYAVWQYWRTTGDNDFLRRYGAEIILDTARFWAARVEWHAGVRHYEVRDVIGPDEYHDHVDNNAYTNAMIRWHLQTALELLAWLAEKAPDLHRDLCTRLNLDEQSAERWRHIVQHIYIPQQPQSHLIEQFDGYFRLEDVTLTDYEPRQQSMQVLLGIEGVRRTQVIKQPDVLMMLYLLPDAFDEETLRANYAYYTPRTDHTHGSSLGPAIQAIMAARLGDLDAAYEHFRRALYVDLEDSRHNTADGIHAASAGAVWQAVVFGFAGLRFTPQGVEVQPSLPPGWERLRFTVAYRGRRFRVDVSAAGAARVEPLEGV